MLASYMATAGTKDTISIAPGKAKDLFVYKTGRAFVGATIEIISGNGEVITSSQLQKRKLVVDFEAVTFGSYTIRLTKGDRKEEVLYIKK